MSIQPKYDNRILKRHSKRVKIFDDEILARKVYSHREDRAKSTYNYKNNNLNNSTYSKQLFSNEVVVKITGNSKNYEAFKRHINYLTRKETLPISVDKYEVYQGKEEIKEFQKMFREYSHNIPKQNEIVGQEKREVYHMVFSMGDQKNVPQKKLEKAVARTVKKLFPNNLSAFVFHGDTDNPHVHTVIKVKDNEGKRLDIRKKDLAELRKGFAKELNELGIEARATIKRNYDRVNTHKHYYKVVDFGHAKYEFSEDPKAKDSYYVRYETTKGNDVYIWSNDLERVVKENNIKKGEKARFAIIKKEPVMIEIKKEIKGSIVFVQKQVYRNVWDASIVGREKELKPLSIQEKQKVKYSLQNLKDKIAQFKQAGGIVKQKVKTNKELKLGMKVKPSSRVITQEQERSR